MSDHSNEIAFVIDDNGDVVITEGGDVITPGDFLLMVKDARDRHNQLTARGFGISSHSGYFEDCKPCRKWATAARMWQAARK